MAELVLLVCCPQIVLCLPRIVILSCVGCTIEYRSASSLGDLHHLVVTSEECLLLCAVYGASWQDTLEVSWLWRDWQTEGRFSLNLDQLPRPRSFYQRGWEYFGLTAESYHRLFPVGRNLIEKGCSWSTCCSRSLCIWYLSFWKFFSKFHGFGMLLNRFLMCRLRCRPKVGCASWHERMWKVHQVAECSQLLRAHHSQRQ